MSCLYGREAALPPRPLPARARDPLGERVTLLPPPGPGLGWPSCRSSAARSVNTYCVLRGPGSPTQPRGLSAPLWEPAGLRSMAPAPPSLRFKGLIHWADRLWAGTWSPAFQASSAWMPGQPRELPHRLLHGAHPATVDHPAPVVLGETLFCRLREKREGSLVWWDQAVPLG